MNSDILLVDDNPSDAELTLRSFRKGGISNTITHLKNGEQLLHYLFDVGGESTGKLPFLILLDIKMPKIDGLEALARIRQDNKTKMIPVIVLGSSDDHPDIPKALRLGANSVIIKPLDLTGFLKATEGIDQSWISFTPIQV